MSTQIVKVPIPKDNESTYVKVLREQSKRWDDILAGKVEDVSRVAQRKDFE